MIAVAWMLGSVIVSILLSLGVLRLVHRKVKPKPKDGLTNAILSIKKGNEEDW